MKAILLLLFATSCCRSDKNNDKNTGPVYDSGQVVYLKPDSVKAIILFQDPFFSDQYWVKYYDDLGEGHQDDVFIDEIF